MEIVLTKEDIEALVQETYRGVKEISFNTKNPKVTLTVDMKDFAQFTSPKQAQKTHKTQQDVREEQQTIKERQEERRKELEARGAIMSSGSNERDRTLRKMG